MIFCHVFQDLVTTPFFILDGASRFDFGQGKLGELGNPGICRHAIRRSLAVFSQETAGSWRLSER